MRIVTVSIIRNEADILESFVRYHLQIVDQMMIVNHRSVDSSAQILHSLKAEGLNLDLAEDASLEQPQSKVLTSSMKKAVREWGADWVLPLDADEFIAAPDRETVRQAIGSLPSDRVIKIPWRTYIPLPSDDLREPNVLKRITHCRSSEPQQIFKVLVPAALTRRHRVVLGFGSHQLSGGTFIRERELPSSETNRMVLAHFPVRSGNQIITKAITGWLACLARSDRSRKDNYHLKRIFDCFRQRHPISPDELTAMTLGYAAGPDSPKADMVCKPIQPEGGEFALRYGTESQCEPLSVLAQMSEEFAQAIGSIRRSSPLVGRLRRMRPSEGSKGT